MRKKTNKYIINDDYAICPFTGKLIKRITLKEMIKRLQPIFDAFANQGVSVKDMTDGIIKSHTPIKS